MKKQSTAGQKPFFAAFLEKQLSNSEKARISGGDGTTSILKDQAETQKYPSDQEDDTTHPDWDCVLTQKYPSDNDEDQDS